MSVAPLDEAGCTDVIDAAGKWILPGFIDAHHHLWALGHLEFVSGDLVKAKEVLDRSFHLVDVLASAFHGGIDTLYVFGSTAP